MSETIVLVADHTINNTHGRLQANVHICGYTYRRAVDDFIWMTTDERWKRAGNGFEDFRDFQATLSWKDFKLTDEVRQRIARLSLEAGASQRSTAKMLGVNVSTISRDLGVANATEGEGKTRKNKGDKAAAVANATPATLPDTDKLAQRAGGNHRAQGTGDNEWFTPVEYIEKARQVLGAIDLDPATSEHAQGFIHAKKFFTRETSGLNQPWEGRVWLNPPYTQPDISNFVTKLVTEIAAGRTTSAILLTHNYTDTEWFHRAESCCDLLCFTKGRIGFVNAAGERAAPTQGQTFFYYGTDGEAFRRHFCVVGFVR